MTSLPTWRKLSFLFSTLRLRCLLSADICSSQKDSINYDLGMAASLLWLLLDHHAIFWQSSRADALKRLRLVTTLLPWFKGISSYDAWGGGVEWWHLLLFKKKKNGLLSQSVFQIQSSCAYLEKKLTVAELQGRQFAKDHIYSGCKRTEELGACMILKFVQALRREATQRYDQESCNTELDRPAANLNRK